MTLVCVWNLQFLVRDIGGWVAVGLLRWSWGKAGGDSDSGLHSRSIRRSLVVRLGWVDCGLVVVMRGLQWSLGWKVVLYDRLITVVSAMKAWGWGGVGLALM